MINILKPKYAYRYSTVENEIVNSILNNSSLSIAPMNVNTLYKCVKDEQFLKSFSRFDIIIFDGYYFKLFIEKIGFYDSIQQISADILMKNLFEASKEYGWSFYFIGGSENSIEKFGNNILSQFPHVNILKHEHGYFRKSEEDEILKNINELRPNILVVGLSVPKEINWVINNKDKIKANVIITCGGYIEQTSNKGIDYYPGNWVYKYHMNWLYRIYKEPMRLWKRYFVQGIWLLWWFPYQLIRIKILKIKE